MSQTRILSNEQLLATMGKCDLTEAELRTLVSFALLVDRKNLVSKYLEVGIFGGGTLHFINHHVAGIQCTGVDLFEDLVVGTDNTHVSGNYSYQAVQTWLGPDIRLIKGNSEDVLPALGEQFDLIFIDGNHTYSATKTDWRNATALLSPSGFIALHNASAFQEPDWSIYNRIDGGPWRVALELKAAGEWKCVAEVDRLVVFTRKK